MTKVTSPDKSSNRQAGAEGEQPQWLTPDAVTACADLRELIELSERLGFDLFVECRSITDDGLPLWRCQVDTSAAIGTGNAVARYEIADRLKGCLAALRAWDVNARKVENALSRNAGSHGMATDEMVEAGMMRAELIGYPDTRLETLVRELYEAMENAR